MVYQLGRGIWFVLQENMPLSLLIYGYLVVIVLLINLPIILYTHHLQRSDYKRLIHSTDILFHNLFLLLSVKYSPPGYRVTEYNLFSWFRTFA